MKLIFVTAILALLVPAFLFSFKSLPAKVDLSGEWKLDEGKSELGEFGGRFAARTIKIKQDDTEIKIERTAPSFGGGDATSEEKLKFDGSVSESTAFGNSVKKSTAKWSEDGNSLTINYTIAFERNGQTTEIKGVETWSLTSEGALSLVTMSSSPRGDMTTKAIYTK